VAVNHGGSKTSIPTTEGGPSNKGSSTPPPQLDEETSPSSSSNQLGHHSFVGHVIFRFFLPITNQSSATDISDDPFFPLSDEDPHHPHPHPPSSLDNNNNVVDSSSFNPPPPFIDLSISEQMLDLITVKELKALIFECLTEHIKTMNQKADNKEKEEEEEQQEATAPTPIILRRWSYHNPKLPAFVDKDDSLTQQPIDVLGRRKHIIRRRKDDDLPDDASDDKKKLMNDSDLVLSSLVMPGRRTTKKQEEEEDIPPPPSSSSSSSNDDDDNDDLLMSSLIKFVAKGQDFTVIQVLKEDLGDHKSQQQQKDHQKKTRLLVIPKLSWRNPIIALTKTTMKKGGERWTFDDTEDDDDHDQGVEQSRDSDTSSGSEGSDESDDDDDSRDSGFGGYDQLNELVSTTVPDDNDDGDSSSEGNPVSSSTYDDDDNPVLWLDEEDQYLRVLFPPPSSPSSPSTTRTSSMTSSITSSFRLLPSYLTPPPPLRIRMTSSKQVYDIHGHEYSEYLMYLKVGDVGWRVERRFNEFRALHAALVKSGESGLPEFPSRNRGIAIQRAVGLSSGNDGTKKLCNDRLNRLDCYIHALVNRSSTCNNIHLLAFVGVMNSGGDKGGDKGSTTYYSTTNYTTTYYTTTEHQSSSKPRPRIHISQLKSLVKWGDIILFRCSSSTATTQRAFTGAEWDHVAIVVPSSGDHQLNLLEATGEGVRCYPLIRRLKAYGSDGFTHYIAIRSLDKEERDDDDINKMMAFIKRVSGLKYAFNLRKLLGGVMRINTGVGMGQQRGGKDQQKIEEDDESAVGEESSSPQPSSSTTDSNQNPTDNSSSYFCSELIASTLKSLGYMHARRNTLYFWPGQFAQGGTIDKSLVDGCRYGEEMIIDFRESEIGGG
jgi:hypothetical protein